jgi:hypothetical protein
MQSHIERLMRFFDATVFELTYLKWCLLSQHYIRQGRWQSYHSVSDEEMKELYNNKHLITIIGITVLLSVFCCQVAYGTNEGSYQYGYWAGSITGPQYEPGANWNPEFYNSTCSPSPSYTQDNGIVIPAVTNKTACISGWYDGWRQWCTNHAVDCVGNITRGDSPPIVSQLREQYLSGARAANGSANSMCPIGSNAAFCHGWDYNTTIDYDHECGDEYANYTGPGLIGCLLDVMKTSQIGGAALPMLVGTWHYVNGTYSGIIKYDKIGDFNLTIPSKTGFGDYTLEGSWGYVGHNILTQCYVGACENSTLTEITPNHIEFIDPYRNTIHLMR